MMAIAPRESFEDVVLGFTFFDEQTGKDGKTERILRDQLAHGRQSFPVFIRNLFEYFGRGRVAARRGFQAGPSRAVGRRAGRREGPHQNPYRATRWT